MTNPFKTVIDAIFNSKEPTNKDKKEIEEATKAGEEAAKIGEKNARFVPKAKVNEEVAKTAKVAKNEQNTKGGEGR